MHKVLSEQNLRKLARKILDKTAIENMKMDYSYNGGAWQIVSFYDASYRLVTTMETISNEQSLYTALPYNKAASYVAVMRKYLLVDNSITVGSSTRTFDWIAIGRWK